MLSSSLQFFNLLGCFPDGTGGSSVFNFSDFGDPVYRGARLSMYDERCPHSPAPHGNAVGFEPSQGVLSFRVLARGLQLSNDRA
jgi:hypothetical protein